MRLREKAVSWCVGTASPARIDEINILQATSEAMREAIWGLSAVPEILLNDAVQIPKVEIPQVSIIKGDAKERIHRCRQYSGKGYKGSHDGRI